MKRFIGSLVLAVTLVIACSGNVTAPHPPAWPAWTSTSWQYSYTTTGYAEGLYSVAGHLIFARSGDSARVSSDGNVVGTFWQLSAGSDTIRGQAVVWPAGLVVNGTVTPGDSFAFVTSDNSNAWPTAGQYLVRGDSLLFSWIFSDSTQTLSLVVHYARSN